MAWVVRENVPWRRERLTIMTALPGQRVVEMQTDWRHRSYGYFVGLIVMGLFYIAAGVNHFANLKMYLVVMPPYIPWPPVMVYFSGVAEILGGIGVLVPDGLVLERTRAVAAWGLVALLIAVSPVHINMCLHPEQFAAIPLWVIWTRLPLQLPLIAWAWNYTRR
jgi:uncharacterized membrane protein